MSSFILDKKEFIKAAGIMCGIEESKSYKLNFDKLERDIMQAQKAINEITNFEDGGTCNFDTCCIYLGRKSKKLVEGLAQMDWRVVPVDMGNFWSGWWFVFFNVKGQGNCRTRMVECGANVLRSLGYQTRIYYQVD